MRAGEMDPTAIGFDVPKLRALQDNSRRGLYDVFGVFPWPESLPEDKPWLSLDLLSVSGAAAAESFTEETRLRLAKWETINLFSVFTHGESDLLMSVMARMTKVGFRDAFEYLHHFVDEENKHMWFFRQFCERYGGKVYPDRKIRTGDSIPPLVEDFLAFTRILIFEEIGDFFNRRVMADAQVPDFIRKIHSVHNRDEARHLAMGRSIAQTTLERAVSAHGAEALGGISAYLERYMEWCLQNLYSPGAYQDAGLPDAYRLRETLLEDPARKAKHREILAKITGFINRLFEEAGIGRTVCPN